MCGEKGGFGEYWSKFANRGEDVLRDREEFLAYVDVKDVGDNVLGESLGTEKGLILSGREALASCSLEGKQGKTNLLI